MQHRLLPPASVIAVETPVLGCPQEAIACLSVRIQHQLEGAVGTGIIT